MKSLRLQRLDIVVELLRHGLIGSELSLGSFLLHILLKLLKLLHKSIVLLLIKQGSIP